MGNVQLSAAQVAWYAANAGFRGPSLQTAVAVALAESGGNTWAVNNDADGSQDQGLWQINTVHISQFTGMVRDPVSGAGSQIAIVGASTMFRPQSNAAAAFLISNGGSNFDPWSTYTSGAYRQYLGRASTAVSTQVFPGNPDTGVNAPPASSVAGAPYILVDDHDRPIISPTAANKLGTTSVASAVTGLQVAGLGDIGPYVTDGQVELDADQIGQLTFTVQDPDGKMGGKLLLNTDVAYKGMRFRISAKETGQGGGAGPQHQVTAQVRIAQQMKVTRNIPPMPSGVVSGSGDDTLSDTPGNTTTTVTTAVGGVGNAYSDGTALAAGLGTTTVSSNPNPSTSITPTDYIATWVARLGGSLYYGAPTYTQAVISPIPVSQGLPQDIYGETLWDVCSRLAANYGYWLFDADGTNVWFGPPGGGGIFNAAEQGQGIAGRGVPFKVGWAGAWGDRSFDAIDYPDCRKTTDDVLTPATIVVKLPRHRGELVRPGMSMWLKGVPDFGDSAGGDQYVVTKVTWALDAGQTPAEITAVTPINPVPTDIALLPQPLPTAAGVGASQQVPYGTQYPLSKNPAATHLADDFVTFALQQQGTPYVWGDANPDVGFDCSGLVMWCAAQVGITMPHYSGAQYQFCADGGGAISVQQALATRGALVFVDQGSAVAGEHVAISLGDGGHVVQAPYTGAVVSIAYVPASSGYWNEGALIPGMDYHDHPAIVPANPNSAVANPTTGINQYGGSGASNYGPPDPYVSTSSGSTSGSVPAPQPGTHPV